MTQFSDALVQWRFARHEGLFHDTLESLKRLAQDIGTLTHDVAVLRGENRKLRMRLAELEAQFQGHLEGHG